MLCFPSSGLLQTFQCSASPLQPFAVLATQPTPSAVLEVYPPAPADRLLAALLRVQQASAVLEQATTKAGYRQITLINKENLPVCKRKREPEEHFEVKRVKTVQQTLAGFVNKV